MVEIDKMIYIDSSGDWGERQHFEPFLSGHSSHALMERLQRGSSGESMHLVTWAGLAGSLRCQYSVKLPAKMSGIS